MSVEISSVVVNSFLHAATCTVDWERDPENESCIVALFVCNEFNYNDYMYYCGEWDKEVNELWCRANTIMYWQDKFYHRLTADGDGKAPHNSDCWEEMSLATSLATDLKDLTIDGTINNMCPIVIPNSAVHVEIIYSDAQYGIEDSGSHQSYISLDEYGGYYVTATQAYLNRTEVSYGTSADVTLYWLWLKRNNSTYTAGYGNVQLDAYSEPLGDIEIPPIDNRPTDWAWAQLYEDSETGAQVVICSTAYIPVDEKGIHPIKASEWNKFTARINAFREYKGRSNYDFTYVYGESNGFDAYGNATEFTPDIYNEAVEAIKAIGGNVSYMSVGTELTASLFLDLARELNAIE